MGFVIYHQTPTTFYHQTPTFPALKIQDLLTTPFKECINSDVTELDLFRRIFCAALGLLLF